LKKGGAFFLVPIHISRQERESVRCQGVFPVLDSVVPRNSNADKGGNHG